MISPLETGGVAEWLKAAVLKTVRPERVSWVRIPPPPPEFREPFNLERVPLQKWTQGSQSLGSAPTKHQSTLRDSFIFFDCSPAFRFAACQVTYNRRATASLCTLEAECGFWHRVELHEARDAALKSSATFEPSNSLAHGADTNRGNQ
jgi:hypothetical protein